MICKYCSYENDNNLEFCTNCGAPLADSREENAQYAEENYNGYNDGYNDGYDNNENDGYMGEDTIPEKKPVDVMGIVGIVLGGVSLLFGCCCSNIPIVGQFISFLSPVLAIAGIIVSAIALKKAKANGDKSVPAIVGIAVSAVGVAIALISVIVAIVLMVTGIGAGVLGSLSEVMYY